MSTRRASSRRAARQEDSERSSRPRETEEAAAAAAAAAAPTSPAAAPPAAPAPAASAAPLPSSASGAHGRPRRRAAVQRNYVDAGSDEEAEEELPQPQPQGQGQAQAQGQGQGQGGTPAEAEEAAATHDQSMEDGEDEEDEDEDDDDGAAAESSSSASESSPGASSSDDEDFSLSPAGKRKGKPGPKSTVPRSGKKPTAAQRKRARAVIDLSPSPPDGHGAERKSAEEEERHRAFLAFAAAPAGPSPVRKAKGPSHTVAAAAAAAGDSDSDSVMEIDAFTPSAPRQPRAHPAGAASTVSGAAAAAAWSNVLRSAGQPAAPAKSSGKGKAKPALARPAAGKKGTPLLSQSEKDARLSMLQEMLGSCDSITPATLIRYLEGAAWEVDAAAINVMDASWFRSSHSDQPAAAAAAAASSLRPAAATPVLPAANARSHADSIALISSDEEGEGGGAASASNAAKRKPPSARTAAPSPSKKARKHSSNNASSAPAMVDAFAGPIKSEGAEDEEIVPLPSSAPAPKPPSWDRMLLCVLNVTAMSTTSGSVLQIGDAVEFRREPFDLDAWLEAQRIAAEEKAALQASSDAAANHASMAAASAAGSKKKKPVVSRGKSSKLTAAAAAAALAKKRPARVLRFTKKGADATHLEMGSVPRILSDVLAPLFDAGCVDLESDVQYVPPRLSPFDSIHLSVSIFVLPALFMYRPPAAAAALDVSAQQANPFFARTFAKASAAAWNPVQAFVRLLKECEIKPAESLEMEMDQAVAKEAQAAPATTTEMPAQLDATMEEAKQEPTAADASGAASDAAAPSSSAASSSAAAASAAPSLAAPSSGGDVSLGLGGADVPVDAESEGVANTEGAVVNSLQLQALYATAAANCATIPEADAPVTLRTTLRPYQRQALHWMKVREAAEDEDQPHDASDGGAAAPSPAAATGRPRRRHPLWDEFCFADPDETRFYVNAFSNECSLDFPESTGVCRGGILADEVMMISLFLANHPSNDLDVSENQRVKQEAEEEGEGEEEEGEHTLDEPMPAAAGAQEKKEEPAAAGQVEGAEGTEITAAASSAAGAAAAVASSSPAAAFFAPVPLSRLRHRRHYMLRDGVTGATLVVCPMSLLSQWRDEIARFSDLACLLYYGAAKDRRKGVAFHEYDVVITTFGVVAAEHRAVVQAQSAANSAALANGRPPVHSLPARQLAALSPLLATHWYRLVLDEGHSIRNRATETAKACFALRGVRKWILSGTLIQNRLDDAFSPLRFLGEQPWCEWGWWHRVISLPFERGDEVALQRLRAILAPLMLRRTKDMRTASGESIVELPPREDETLVCELSDSEAAFYDAIFTRSKATFEGFLASNSVMHRYMQVLTLLLRLRQCCDHPFLVLGRGKTGDEFDKDIDVFMHRFASRVDLAAPEAPSVAFLANLRADLKRTGDDRQECPLCLCPPEIPVLTECAHLMCRECATPLFNERGMARCPVCRAVISREKLFLVPAPASAASHDGDGSAAASSLIDPKRDWQHSSKTRRLMAELDAIRDGPDPTAKSLVFSQWTSMLDLLQIPLSNAGVPFLRLDGSMSQAARASVLTRFAREPQHRVLLISLKAGGVGLNLVAANYVFFMDCWWNPSVEEQACQRVHRIGQPKRTYVKRFVCRGTVEERILQLQERKRLLARSVEVSPEELAKVQLGDLVDLFRD